MTLDVDLRREFGGFSLQVQFSAPAAGITGLFGPSGCGKSSLLRAVAGLDPQARGDIRVNARQWQSADGIRLATHRRRVGMVFQQPSLFPHLSVAGNLRFGQQRRGQARDHQEALLETLGVSLLLDRTPHTLSGGQSQRVAIAQALLSEPDWLLMDEPLSALDMDARESLLQTLETLHDRLQIPILYVSHQYEEIARLADHLLLMQHGEITASGSLEKLSTQPTLPLCHRKDAAAVLDGEIAEFDNPDQLLQIHTAAGPLWVSAPSRPNGTRARLRVYARDVSLSRGRAADSSILNILPATVTSMHEETDGQICVVLRVGDTQLLSRISRRSRRLLELETGVDVYAQVKAAALLRAR